MSDKNNNAIMKKAGEKAIINPGTSTLLTVGTVLGTSILFALPLAISSGGKNIWISLLLVGVASLFTNLAPAVTSEAIPADAGPYKYMTRLMHPAMAIFELMDRAAQFIMLALVANALADFLGRLVPSAPGTLIAVLLLIVIGFLNLFGAGTAARIGNILSLLALIGMIIYIAYAISAEPVLELALSSYMKTMETDLVSVNAEGLAGVISLIIVASLFIPAFNASQISSDASGSTARPDKTIAKAFIIGMLIVLAVYIPTAILSAKLIFASSYIESIVALAQMFMPAGAFTAFVLLGAFGLGLSTMNGLFIQQSLYLGAFAEDKLLPASFDRTNNKGVRPMNVILTIIITAAITLAVPNDSEHVESLVYIAALLIVITQIARLVPCFSVRRRYPNAYKKSVTHLPIWMMITLATIGGIILLASTCGIILSCPAYVWIAALVIAALSAAYFFARKAYLRGKGIDLVKGMSEPPQRWIDIENS